MPVSDEDRNAHIGVLNEALKKFEEKDAKYQGLWKERGAVDSAHHVKHKAARVSIAINEGCDPEPFIEDAVDLINYCVFFVLNARDGR